MTGRLLKTLAAISGAVLFLIMCLVSYAVFQRYVMNDPVLGDAEIVQIGMSLVVMMAMPYATANGAHIRVDIFCLLYTSPSPRDATLSRMPSSA